MIEAADDPGEVPTPTKRKRRGKAEIDAERRITVILEGLSCEVADEVATRVSRNQFLRRQRFLGRI